MKKLVLKDMTGKTIRQAEITRFPPGVDCDSVDYDKIYDEVISELENEYDALDFSTDGEEEVLGWNSYTPNKKLWGKLLKGLSDLGFEFKP